MRCTRLLGHKWGRWSEGKEVEGRREKLTSMVLPEVITTYFTEILQCRVCEVCNKKEARRG